MAIHQEEVREMSGGFSKEIDKGAEQQVFDLLQKYQYQHPIKSTIRELVSNGLDGIKEKQVAESILKGRSFESDHYVDIEGDVYKDSKFDPNYYDLKFFSTDNIVEIIYRDGGEMGKDTVIIRDHGVGLGGSRLKGYFNLGYSSKRLNKFALGKFGLGAKSPLSTGAPCYTMCSRYNGAEFIFNIYSHKVESIVPQYDLDAMLENPFIHIPGYVDRDGNPVPVYFNRTLEKNMVEVTLQAKKHHKQKYIDAVTSQLLYFDNVKCYEESVNGQRTEIPVKAEIMFENDLIVLSNNSPYSKPHLLLNGVNYGYIDFRELELEEKLGNIGIKVAPEDVSVNPSRESLIWDDVTRKVIIDKFNEVVGIAETTINQSLKETDFLKWLRNCAMASAAKSWFNDGDSVIGRLSKIVDMSKIELSYPPNPEIKFNGYSLDGLHAVHTKMVSFREGSKTIKKVDYSPFWKSALEENKPIIYQAGPTSNRRNKYILAHLYPQGYLSIRLDVVPEDGAAVTSAMIPSSGRIDEMLSNKRKVTVEVAKQRVATLHNYLLASQGIMWYEKIEVPEDFVANETDKEEEEDTKTVEAKESAVERRKLAGTTIVHTPRITYSLDRKATRPYEMQKIEAPVPLIDTWHNEEVFYSSNDYEPLLMTACMMTRYEDNTLSSWSTQEDDSILPDTFENWRTAGYSQVGPNEYPRLGWFADKAPLRLIKVAQDNVKYYRDFKHITRFFKEIKNKTITMSNALLRWNTARLIQEKLSDLKFLNGFAPLNKDKAIAYERLTGYVSKYWRDMNVVNKDLMGADENTTKQITSHLDKVGQFQLFVRQNPEDKDSIAELAQQLFNPQKGVEIENGCAIDTEIYDLYNELLDWAQPVLTLANMLGPLTDKFSPLTNEQEEEIRHYFKYRNCPL